MFLTTFAQKGYFQSQTGKVNNTTELCIFELVELPIFSSNWHLLYFGPNRVLPQTEYYDSEMENSKYLHGNLHIHVKQGTKFQLKLTI